MKTTENFRQFAFNVAAEYMAATIDSSELNSR
jgi:hypothetical protein